jgi:hypothetical protein
VSERVRDPESGLYTSKLTPEVQGEVVKALLGGSPPEAACAYAGIQRSTYYEWLKRGRAALSDANGNAAQVVEENPYAGFVVAVDHALSRFITGTVATIGAAGRTRSEGDWRALAWLLERRFPGLFGQRTRHEITGRDGGPIELEHAIVLDPGALDRLPLERKLILADILAEMDGEVIEGDGHLLELEA